MEAGQGPGGGEVGDPAENSVPKPYVPTEEERQLLKECGEESARYRGKLTAVFIFVQSLKKHHEAFPLAAVSMLATSLLIRKGVLRDNSRFGSLTKVAFAGTCGYLAGKISYLPICSEKFKKLKDSPIGDVLRQAQRHSSHNRSSRKSEFSDIPSQSFTESSSQRPGSPLSPSYSDDYSSTDRALSSYEPVPFSASLNESSPTGITDYTVQDPAPVPEESRKKKGISYEELRNKHRETYEVMLPPKAETPIKFSQEKPVKEGLKQQW
ncbi:OCIA domain-containing protein 1 isoform X2 [Apteryx rowi]|uniref:OCIA domain-containing protein 1 isoform X2 n=1 Tax=Apteryx rowi TaxID=308060 RepID=UPI000E1DCBCF|nr:OCIA domain-containing protein 1 isoform X2 [Apteryx rowi]